MIKLKAEMMVTFMIVVIEALALILRHLIELNQENRFSKAEYVEQRAVLNRMIKLKSYAQEVLKNEKGLQA
jgi:hypothetical protein